jgi:hypothetical protein
VGKRNIRMMSDREEESKHKRQVLMEDVGKWQYIEGIK